MLLYDSNCYIINLIHWNWGYSIFRQTQMLVPFRPQPAPAAPQGHDMFLGQVECGPHWWLGRLGLGLYDPKDMNKHGLCMLVFDVWSMWSTAFCLDVCFRKTGLFISVSKLQGFLLEKKHLNKMKPTNPNAHTYVNGTDVKTHGYAATHNTFLQ